MKATHNKNLKPHFNVAAYLNKVFMSGIIAKVLAQQARDRMLGVKTGYDSSQGRKLPRGFKHHKPAGTKIARLARNSAIGIRTPIWLQD